MPQGLQALAAGRGTCRDEIVTFSRQFVTGFTLCRQLLVDGGEISFQLLDTGSSQRRAYVGKEHSHSITLLGQIVLLGNHGIVLIRVFYQRGQQLQLFLGSLHGLVGVFKIIEVVDDLPDPTTSIGGFEHVSAHKLVEIPHGLH